MPQLLEALRQPGLPAGLAPMFESVLGVLMDRMRQLEQESQRNQQLLSETGITSSEAARQFQSHINTVAEGAMVDTAQLTAQNAAMQQEVQQLQDQVQTMKAQFSKVAAKERNTAAVHVPSSAPMDEVLQAVARAAKVQIKGASYVHRARGGSAPAAPAGQAAAAAEAGSSEGAGSSAAAGAGARSGGGFDVLVLELRSQADVRAVLSGRTRMALKNAGLPFFVDDDLSYAERQQRRQLQPLRRQLRAQGKRTRWAKAQLQQRVRDAQGRWSWQVVSYPEAPADSEVEEGQVTGDGQEAAGGDAVAAGAAAS